MILKMMMIMVIIIAMLMMYHCQLSPASVSHNMAARGELWIARFQHFGNLTGLILMMRTTDRHVIQLDVNQKNNDRHLLQADYHLRSKHCHRKLETKGDRIDPSVWINGPELRSEGKYECNRSNMIRSFHFVRRNLEINLKSLDQDLALFQFREGL